MSDDKTNRVALVLRAQDATYEDIAGLLGITEEEARKAVSEGVKEAQIDHPDETKVPAVQAAVVDALWMTAANFQTLVDFGVPGFSRKVATANKIREQLISGELEIRRVVK